MHKQMAWVMGLLAAVLLAAAACGGITGENHAVDSHAAACDPAALPAVTTRPCAWRTLAARGGRHDEGSETS